MFCLPDASLGQLPSGIVHFVVSKSVHGHSGCFVLSVGSKAGAWAGIVLLVISSLGCCA